MTQFPLDNLNNLYVLYLPMNVDRPTIDPSLFPLDPKTVFLNHGSFGCCPIAVLDHQQELRMQLERQPVKFYQRDFEPLLDRSREALGEFIGANGDDLVYVSNATAGVNTVLRSLSFKPGDELLVSNHEYNACRNAIHYAADRCGATVVTIEIPFPLKSDNEVLDSIMSKVTDKTRLLLIDHVTSQTGLVLPVKEIVQSLSERGIDTLVDGAHAPGMIPLEIDKLDAAYYTGNCHKWLCAPKTAGFLHVRKDKQSEIRPLTISHGANSPRSDRSRFQIEFGWMGTRDPSAALSVPFVIEYLDKQVPGGWAKIMERNRQLAIAARTLILQALDTPPPSPDSMIGSLASIPLPDSQLEKPYQSLKYLDYWQEPLIEKHGIEVPVITWPNHPKRLVRISAQLYNSLPQYKLLADALKGLCDESNRV
jgi:isopenicillin-N epimerase